MEVPARLIMTASDMAYYRRETFSLYVASKHGVLGLVRSWAKEFAPRVGMRCRPPGGTALALGPRRLAAICPVDGSRLHDADPRAGAGALPPSRRSSRPPTGTARPGCRSFTHSPPDALRAGKWCIASLSRFLSAGTSGSRRWRRSRRMCARSSTRDCGRRGSTGCPITPSPFGFGRAGSGKCCAASATWLQIGAIRT